MKEAFCAHSRRFRCRITRVQVKIVKSPDKKSMATDRQRVYNALLDASLAKPQSTSDTHPYVPEVELTAAANALGLAGSISDLIIAERAESY